MSGSISQIVSSDRNSLTIDCFIELSKFYFFKNLILIALQRRNSIHFVKFLLLASRPIVQATLVFGFMVKPFILRRKIGNSAVLKNQIIIGLIILFFLVQPGIFQMGIEAFKYFLLLFFSFAI